MKSSIAKLFILIFIILLLNLVIGTNFVQNFDCRYYSPGIDDAKHCLPNKNFGFYVWLVIFSIPLLTFFTGFIYKSLKIFLLVDLIWILVTEILVRIFQIPTIYSSLEHSYLEYSIFAVQTPLVIYSKGVIVSDQMKVLAILVTLSLGSGYLGSLINQLFQKILKYKLFKRAYLLIGLVLILGMLIYIKQFGYLSMSSPSVKQRDPESIACKIDSDCGLNICGCKAMNKSYIQTKDKICTRFCGGKPKCVNNTCQLVKDNNSEKLMSLGEEFILKQGEVAEVTGKNITLKIESFTNSPCPKGTTCIWSGVQVVYKLTVDGKDYQYSSSIGPSPYSSYYEAPYDVFIKDSDYETYAKFLVDKPEIKCLKLDPSANGLCWSALAKRFKNTDYCQNISMADDKKLCISGIPEMK